MKRFICFFSLFCFYFSPLAAHTTNYRAFFSPSHSNNEIRFVFLGNSGVIVNTSQGTFVIDPATNLQDYDIDQLKHGGIDLVLYTHSHGDHYNSLIASKLFKATGAPVLAEPLVAEMLSSRIPPEKLTSGLPGNTYTFGKITVKIVKGVHLGPINLYQIQLGDIRIFHGGDSGYVPLKNYSSDVAFLPTGSPSPSCSPEEAYKMAFDLKPTVAVAFHGSKPELMTFEKIMKEKMPDTMVIIPETHTLLKVHKKQSY